jgi:hypothetical protein
MVLRIVTGLSQVREEPNAAGRTGSGDESVSRGGSSNASAPRCRTIVPRYVAVRDVKKGVRTNARAGMFG